DIIWYQIDEIGSALALASFLRALRPFFLFYVGYYFFKKNGSLICSWSTFFAILLPAVLIFSDIIFNSRWPTPRWGGYFLNFGVYGFPNSPAFFYVVCLAISIGGLMSKAYPKNFFIASIVVAGSIIVFVGSRNAIG